MNVRREKAPDVLVLQSLVRLSSYDRRVPTITVIGASCVGPVAPAGFAHLGLIQIGEG